MRYGIHDRFPYDDLHYFGKVDHFSEELLKSEGRFFRQEIQFRYPRNKRKREILEMMSGSGATAFLKGKTHWMILGRGGMDIRIDQSNSSVTLSAWELGGYTLADEDFSDTLDTISLRHRDITLEDIHRVERSKTLGI